MRASLADIARLIGGTILGDAGRVVTGIAAIESAGPDDVAFVANPRYVRCIPDSHAGAIICAPGTEAHGKTLVWVDNPYLAYARLLRHFNPPPPEPGTIDERAHVGDDTRLGETVTIYPFVYIGNNCTIGDNVTIYPFCFLGNGVSIGEDSFLHPNVTVRENCRIGRRVILHSGAVIGSDGFGFAKDGARYCKIPQLGCVQIDDDAEIGAGTTIDRAAMDRTWIKRGTKIDNLVQIAHNVVIGEDSAIVAQVGIAGSTRLGDRVTMAGQAATVGHITIGDDVIVGARGAASADIPSGQVVSGTPHMPHRTWLKASSVFPKLPEMRKAIVALEHKIEHLQQQLDSLKGSTP
jgi:UDP-3-O-[3-hydroxymyristoyl] glucosamine N-acyltransferase